MMLKLLMSLTATQFFSTIKVIISYFKKINIMTRSNKNTTLLLALLFGLTASLASCASGKYYKAGADYQAHPERYTKDSQQTYNDPYYRYAQPSYGYQQEGQSNKRCKKKR